MIPKGVLKHGDYLIHKTNRKTRWYMDIGGFTETLREDLAKTNDTDVLNGYNHISRIDRDINFTLEATPPYCVRSRLTKKYWKKITKRADIEVWRFSPAIPEEMQNKITDAVYELGDLKWNKKKNKYIGRRYDWVAIFPLFAMLGIHKESWLHCAELQANACKRNGIILSSQGAHDSLVSPNNIFNGGLLSKIYVVRR